ncbi:hypothetical protein MA16_Dca023541 [Dendrobium catenatum]|uniref:Uncharacterized protein n=1 Tax=Dendrobium catenatum TaxID=906689 RepID=A0A2I0VHQ5_9ASPA|nr:hypothetical protein MA16_Dca023541 [Dendrobium catenatum]
MYWNTIQRPQIQIPFELPRLPVQGCEDSIRIDVGAPAVQAPPSPIKIDVPHPTKDVTLATIDPGTVGGEETTQDPDQEIPPSQSLSVVIPTLPLSHCSCESSRSSEFGDVDRSFGMSVAAMVGNQKVQSLQTMGSTKLEGYSNGRGQNLWRRTWFGTFHFATDSSFFVSSPGGGGSDLWYKDSNFLKPLLCLIWK